MGGPAGSLRSRQHSSKGHGGTQVPPPRQGSSQEGKLTIITIMLEVQLTQQKGHIERGKVSTISR